MTIKGIAGIILFVIVMFGLIRKNIIQGKNQKKINKISKSESQKE
mgnify:CR=1 FL=1